MHSTGYFADPPDVVARRGAFRHYAARSDLRAGALPKNTTNRFVGLATSKGGPGVLNQSSTGSCVGHGVAGVITAKAALRQKPIPLVSPIAPYTLGRDLDLIVGADNVVLPLTDNGSEPNQAVRALTEYGIISAKTWGNYPADPATINNLARGAVLLRMAECKFNGAYFLPNDNLGGALLGTLMALAAAEPVTNSIQGSGSAFQAYTGGVLTRPIMTGYLDHYTYLIDYAWGGTDTDWQKLIAAATVNAPSTFTPLLPSLTFYGVNSWGESWGESDVDGITSGLYRIDGEVFAASSDLGVWAIDIVGTEQ